MTTIDKKIKINTYLMSLFNSLSSNAIIDIGYTRTGLTEEEASNSIKRVCRGIIYTPISLNTRSSISIYYSCAYKTSLIIENISDNHCIFFVKDLCVKMIADLNLDISDVQYLFLNETSSDACFGFVPLRFFLRKQINLSTRKISL